MAIQLEQHQFRGMQRDISVSKISNEFIYDAMNIRLTARKDNTLLSITNEKGNKEIVLKADGINTTIEGTVIGHNILNKYLILFTTGTSDKIYRLEYKDTYFEVTLLYNGLLNFSIDNPIESIGIYENEEVQKIYWVDGKNPVRFINITKTYTSNSDIFNFKQDLQLDEIVTVTSNKENKGLFPAGTVQYVFTYYNNHGAETNIFYHSPLLYSHVGNRGGSPEESASNSFNIKIELLETKFDYVRIYSIVRTSIDSTPTVKKVVDLSTKSGTISYNDTNNLGEIIDPSILLYLGGENIIPECITHKDNTLFLGNYVLPNNIFSDSAINDIKGDIVFDYKKTPNYEYRGGLYDYTSQLDMNSYEITTLKSSETYRFGVQFQNRIGRWSEVLWIGDSKVDKYPSVNTPSSAVELTELQYNILVKGKYTIPDNVLEEARELGYIRARGVIVYPSNSDRDIICQGILNPTVYKTDDRENNSPYSQSSWFFRPYVKKLEVGSYDQPNYGSIASYTDKGILSNYGAVSRSTEIGITLNYTDSEGKKYDKDFYVDSSIVTMHSPDIEFQDSIEGFENSKLECSIIGYIGISNGTSFRDVQSSTISTNSDDYGFYAKFPNYTNATYMTNMLSTHGGILISGINWISKPITKDGDNWKSVDKTFGWLVSPWQRSGSLINDFAKRKDDQVVAKLKYNRLTNTRVSYKSFIGSHNWKPKEGISNITVFNSKENVINYIGDTGHSYYGNIDKVLVPAVKTYGFGSKVGYTRAYNDNLGYDNPSIDELYKAVVLDFDSNGVVTEEGYLESKDPVSMKYKSTKHLIFEFNSYEGQRVILPSINNEYFEHTNDETAVYDTLNVGMDSILWLAELSRIVPKDIKFGGQSKDALLANRWHIAGDPVCINKENVTIEYLQGDTYLQRYDCLKTYPYTLEDENSVTEILSFFCETRVNIDGRYDRNRKNFNNLAVMDTNFNLLNPVYSQVNNFFNYFILDSNLRINTFNNSITWSKEKQLGEQVDQWTNITLASTLDMDGDKGKVNALKVFNNEIYCFQDSGFSNILFNSRVQIPASDGVPIEITNGLKVQGKRYISNTIGCTNKYSIVSSPSGLYFIDNNGKSLYKYNGQIQSLSNSLGFSQWVSENNSFTNWNPITFDNIISYYDNANEDIYFVNKDNCLVFSEKINQFTSFMSYESIYPFFNMKDKLFSIKNNNIWQHNEGDYNMFYGRFKPYYVTIISNSNPNMDKIYNTIEFRADSWDNNNLLSYNTFDTLEVWNEYQKGELCLDFKQGLPSSLKKKFRVWRANIPRDNHNMRDRIRNTWAYIKLSMNNSNTWKTVLHDISVHYFM